MNKSVDEQQRRMMLHNGIYYQTEKRHVKNRVLFIILATLFGFLFFSRTTGSETIEGMLVASFLMAGLSILSLLHYLFILYYPHKLVSFRKQFTIVIDMLTLTFLIVVFGKYGLFLLPFYIWLIMWNSSSYGIRYYPCSIISSIISWTLIYFYSPYWQEHFDIVLAFALPALLIPPYYLKTITSISQENVYLNEALSTTEQDANYDALTGIPNRKMYEEILYSTLKRREPFALFFIDLNKFKPINDKYGHQMGDNVLIEVAQRLQSCMDEEDFLARLGGDEFVIVSKKKKVFLPKFIEKIEKNVIGLFKTDNLSIPIELSMGISLYPSDAKEKVILGQYADEAMYAAKQNPYSYHMFWSELKAETNS
jgi:diguanylate cyclase (GGDEF)-like protein